MNRIQEMANFLVDGIKFTVDIPERYVDKKVPMLDLAVWLEKKEGGGRKVRHTFYQKPTTSPLVFHSRGACSIKQKIVILGEETKRRMLNQDRDHTLQERIQEIARFSQKLVDSEYTREVRKDILMAGIRRYYLYRSR